MRALRDPRQGAAATEFAVIGLVLVVFLIVLIEVGWQLAVDVTLEHGARAAARFGLTGATAPAGLMPPPASRAEALTRVVLAAAGGMLEAGRLSLTATSSPGFGSYGDRTAAQAGPGVGSQATRYTVTYDQPYLTGLGAVLAGSPSLLHRAVITVENEPFPAS